MQNILSSLAYQAIAFDVPDGKSGAAKSVNTGPLVWANGSYLLDPTQNNQLLEMQNIQSIFVDNYTTGTMTISVASTGHMIRVPPKTQCFMPLICGDRPVITFSNTVSSGISQAWLMNIPALGVIWQLP